MTAPDEAVAALDRGDLTLEAAAELATVGTQDELQEAADIAFSVAAETTEGWTAGIDEPDPAVVAARLREAAWRYTVAAALHEALAHRGGAMTAEGLLERLAEQTLTEADASRWAAHATREELWSVADEAVQLLHEAFRFLETPHSDLVRDARIVQRQAGVVAAIHEAMDIERTDGESAGEDGS